MIGKAFRNVTGAQLCLVTGKGSNGIYWKGVVIFLRRNWRSSMYTCSGSDIEHFDHWVFGEHYEEVPVEYFLRTYKELVDKQIQEIEEAL